ncbi:WD40 repeat domain-containing protein, partial [bacterium]|nr:WD40 repeat domain-containing protein [bacterium]
QPQPPAVRPAPAWREAVNLPFDDGPVHSVAFRRDGKEFAAGGDRSRAVAWTVPGFTKRHTWVTGGESPTAVGYSPDGRVLAVVDDRLSVLFNTATDLPFPARAPFPPAGRAVAFSAPYGPQSGPVRHRFAVADGKTAHVVTWPETLAPITKSFGPVPGAVAPGGEPGVGVAWAPDGRRLVFVPNAKADGRWLAQVWDAGSGAGSAVLAHGTAPVTAVAWSPDGKLIATGCRRGDVVTWDTATLKERTRSRVGGRQNASEVHALAFSPDGQTLAAAVTLDSGLNVERVVMLDPATGARTGTDLTTFRAGGELTPRALAFSPDGKLLAVGLDGRNLDTNARVGAVRVYTTEPEPDGQATGPARPAAWRPRPVATERAAVAAVAFAPNGKTFALAGADGVVEVWDAATLKGRATSTRVKAPGPGALAFMPTTSFLATADADGVGLHDPSGIKMSHRVWSLPTQVVAFAPNGKQIALRGSSNGGLVRVLPFPIDPAAPGGRAREDTDEVPPVAWSPDGKRLMAVIRLPSSGFWALTEPTVAAAPHVLGHGPDKFGGVTWSGDGKWIVTGGHDGKVIVTDSAAMKEVRKWSVAGPGERARVRSVVLSPDGATVFTGIEAWPEQQARPTAPVHAVVGWELATGREVVRLTLPPGGPVDALALSPDGRLLVAGRNPVAAPDPAPSAPALLVWERP